MQPSWPVSKSEIACRKAAETYKDITSLCVMLNNNPSVIEDEVRVHGEMVPCLYDIDKVYGRMASETFILTQLQMLNNSTNVKDRLTLQQLNDTASDICREKRFRQLNLYEWMLFFHRMKMGYYGDLYGRLDTFTICSALNQKFMKERSDAIDRIYRTHSQKEEMENRRAAEGMAQIIQQAMAAGYDKVSEYVRDHQDEVQRRINPSSPLSPDNCADGAGGDKG